MADTDYTLQNVLDAKRRDGSLIREKARVLVEDWLDKLYPRMCDPDIPTSALMEIGKTLIEVGDLKPKKEITQGPAGPGFSITINIPQHGNNPPITIEGTTIDHPVSSEPDGIEEEPLAIEGSAPTNFNTLDFQFNNDLSANVGSLDEEEI